MAGRVPAVMAHLWHCVLPPLLHVIHLHAIHLHAIHLNSQATAPSSPYLPTPPSHLFIQLLVHLARPHHVAHHHHAAGRARQHSACRGGGRAGARALRVKTRIRGRAPRPGRAEAALAEPQRVAGRRAAGVAAQVQQPGAAERPTCEGPTDKATRTRAASERARGQGKGGMGRGKGGPAGLASSPPPQPPPPLGRLASGSPPPPSPPPGRGASGAASTITAARALVFCAMSGAAMPCAGAGARGAGRGRNAWRSGLAATERQGGWAAGLNSRTAHSGGCGRDAKAAVLPPSGCAPPTGPQTSRSLSLLLRI